MSSKIEWTNETWNPVVGCTKVSIGCQNCYAERMMYRQVCMGAARHEKNPDSNDDAWIAYSDVIDEDTHKWNGEVSLRYSQLDKPLHWKKPRMIFVCSMGDLFHESVPFEFIDKVFRIMRRCSQHTFQILTKRPTRMKEYITGLANRLNGTQLVCMLNFKKWPLTNIWLGVTAENQEWWDKRKEAFFATPTAVHFVSNEPLLGEIKYTDEDLCKLNQIIVGGESGPGARPMHPDWARGIRDQCVAAGVPFFFKQWGEWLPLGQNNGQMIFGAATMTGRHTKDGESIYRCTDGNYNVIGNGVTDVLEDNMKTVARIGKKKAGRLLDGKEWNEYPQAQEAENG